MNGTNTVLGKNGGLHHAAIRARDFDASVRFYTETLGFTTKMAWGEGDGRAVMLDAGNGGCIEIFAGGKNVQLPEGVILHFAFRTDNCDAVYRRAIAAGAVSTMEPTDVDVPSRPTPNRVRIAFCKGPDGEVVEFFQSELK